MNAQQRPGISNTTTWAACCATRLWQGEVDVGLGGHVQCMLTRSCCRCCAACRRVQRLLAHRTAQHWGLETSTINQGPEQGRIVALRTHASRPPQVRSAGVWQQPLPWHCCSQTGQTWHTLLLLLLLACSIMRAAMCCGLTFRPLPLSLPTHDAGEAV